jgi:hypothetical protein
MPPDDRAVSVTPIKQTLADVFRALDRGQRSIEMPSGNVVSLHSRLVSVAVGLGRCKDCGASADVAVEIATGPGLATLWFVRRLDDGDWLPMTSDHLVPESMGGATHGDNLRCLCRGCNVAKKADLPPGIEVERRWCAFAVFGNLARAHAAPGQPARKGYRRFLKDRASGRANWFPPMEAWVDEPTMRSLQERLSQDYGIVGAVPPLELPCRLFPHVPRLSPDEMLRIHADAEDQSGEAPAPTMSRP